MDKLYGYVFWFNGYENKWYAIPRDKYKEFFNTDKVEGVLSNKNINVLTKELKKKKWKKN